MRVAFLSTHPIQYHADWFQALSGHPSLDLDVLYCWKPDADAQGQPGFGVAFEWDVPLLEGYSYRFLRNVAREPSTDSFFGMDSPELADLIASRTYDAVVTNGWHYKSAWQAMRSCWASNVPVLVRSDSHLKTERRALARAVKALPYRWFIPRLNACLPVGRLSAEYFAHYGASPERVHIVPHAANSLFGREAPRALQSRAATRERWNAGENETVFLFAGKFTSMKRPLDFVRAIAAASRAGATVVGVMVGDGPLRAECEERARSEGAPVRFAGFVNQSKMVNAYVAADALVLPSSGGETWGLVVNEAMSCGRPAIVSDRVGCGPDLVESGSTGFVFRCGDVAGLADRFREAASDGGRLSAMGSAAMRRVESHSVAASASAMVEALHASVPSR